MLPSQDQIVFRISQFRTKAGFRQILLMVSLLDLGIVGALLYFAGPQEGLAALRILMPLFLGILLEHFHLRTNGLLLLLIGLVSLLMSAGAFLWPLEPDSIHRWPYWFIACFLFLSVLVHIRTVNQHRNELSCLAASLALQYLTLEHLRVDYYLSPPQLAGFCVATVAVVWLIMGHIPRSGITKTASRETVSRTSLRPLILSLWNGVALLILTIYQLDLSLDSLDRFMGGESVPGISWNFFLLGVSAIYSAHNFGMLAGLLDDSHGDSILELHRAGLVNFRSSAVAFWLCLGCTVSLLSLNLRLAILAPVVAANGCILLLSVAMLVYSRFGSVASD